MKVGTFLFLSVVVMMTAFSGCADVTGTELSWFSKKITGPTVVMAKEALEKLWIKSTCGQVRLSDFTKTDSKRMMLFGVPVYQLECEATAQFMVDGYLLEGVNGYNLEYTSAGSRFLFVTEKPQLTSNILGASMFFVRIRDKIEAGEEIKVKGLVLFFEKTDNGWRVVKLPSIFRSPKPVS